MSQQQGATRATGLREAFDRTFAHLSVINDAVTEDLLAIRLGGQSYALRLSEIAGVHADKKIVRLPTPSRVLLGLAGFRGATLPVYDLRLLLGLSAEAAPRWLAIAAAAPVALAFEAVDAHLRVPRESIAAKDGGERAPHLHELVTAQGVVRAVVDLASVIATINRDIPSDKS